MIEIIKAPILSPSIFRHWMLAGVRAIVLVFAKVAL